MVTTRRQSAAASQAHQAAAAGATAQAQPDAVAANGSAKHVESKTWAQTAGTGDRNSFLGLTGPLGYAVALCGALLLMAVCPAVVIYTYQIHSKFDGSVVLFGRHVLSRGFSALVDLWPLPSITAWKYYAVFGVFEAFLQLALPGAVFLGPTTPKGNVPRYKANGVLAYVTTLVAFFALWWFGVWDPANIYDNFAELMSASNVFSLGLCAFLYVKGHLFPSSSDSGTTGSLVYDVFWGVELYPRIGKHFDIKTWTNCRMGMMSWAVISLSFPFAQLRDTGAVSNSILVSAVVMNVYVFKFFLWETGYWRTMDIAHDRAGYYLCWGCLNWLPCIYTSPAMYLVNHPLHLHPALTLAFTGAGLLMVYINYAADCQRQEFRATDGRIRIWGREPVIVRAKYTTGNGEEKVSLLLASGWWGVARHFHYVPEILASFFWTVPCLFSHLLPYFYVIYLTLLLLDRSFRDDTRCRSKYGKYWDEYCRLVPWKIIPFVF